MTETVEKNGQKWLLGLRRLAAGNQKYTLIYYQSQKTRYLSFHQFHDFLCTSGFLLEDLWDPKNWYAVIQTGMQDIFGCPPLGGTTLEATFVLFFPLFPSSYVVYLFLIHTSFTPFAFFLPLLAFAYS